MRIEACEARLFQEIWGYFKSILAVFQDCFKSVSTMFQQCSKSFSKKFPRLFQEIFKCISRVFQERFKSVSRVFQECFKSVSSVFYVYFKSIWRVFQKCLNSRSCSATCSCFSMGQNFARNWFVMLSLRYTGKNPYIADKTNDQKC